MKDLIAKLQLDANCALGAIWMHIDAQAARIAELEEQQAFGIGETYANALSRIAELEAQIAVKSAPVADQHGYEHQRAVLEGERNAAADAYFGARNHLEAAAHRRIFDAGFDRGFTARPVLSACTKNQQDQTNELRAWLSKLEDEVMPLHSDAKKLFTRVRTYLQACGYFKAPGPADTDKLREVIKYSYELRVAIENAAAGYGEFIDPGLAETIGKEIITYLAASTALQAPVREVPEGWEFNAADFSLKAAGKSNTGHASLIRDLAGRAAWHALDDDGKDSTPLYIYGDGETISAAIADAVKRIPASNKEQA